MDLRVEKYGGSSVATITQMEAIAKHLVNRQRQGQATVVVVSAMGKSTNDLIAMAHQLDEAPSKRELDQLMATGEMVSISLLAMAIMAQGGDAISLSGAQAGIRVQGEHGAASIHTVDPTRLHQELAQGRIVIVAGFQGLGADGATYTLGRGGSDITATALAAALGCPAFIFTDVDGIHTVDPQLYPEAKCMHHLSYDEAMAMATYGAKIIEPEAVHIAKRDQIPIYIGRSLASTCGTIIDALPREQGDVVGMAVYRNIQWTTAEGPLCPTWLQSLRASHISTLFSLGEESAISIGLKPDDVPYAHRLIPPGTTLDGRHVDMITVVYRGEPSWLQDLPGKLAAAGCPTSYIHPGQSHISFVVEKEYATHAVNTLGRLLAL